jgi:hypothetical protein
VATLTVYDESPTGRPVSDVTIPGLPERISVREIVRLRVREEVARHNANPVQLFRGLVQPTDTETTANGFRLRQVRRLDWEAQADAAVAAFERNGYFILVGDHQVDHLDEVVDLTGPDLHVTFVKLTQLVGG